MMQEQHTAPSTGAAQPHEHRARHAGHHHGHHELGSAAAKGERRLAIVMGLTTVYLVAQVVGGILTNSLALLADAAHMLTDVFGIGLALLAIRFARRPPTPAKTYGFYRTEILAALVNSVVLLGVGAFILYEAWRRFQEPPEVHSLPMLVVAIGGLIVNLIGVWLLHSGSKESLNLRGAFLEVFADLLGSVGVIAAAVIILLTGWWPADPIISVAIGLFILPRTWGLLKSAVDVLLESVPAHINLDQIEAAMRSVPGVRSLHDVHVWTITSGFDAMSGHVVASGRPSAEVLHDLLVLVRERFGIQHATLQVERAGHVDECVCCTIDPRCLPLEPEQHHPEHDSSTQPPRDQPAAPTSASR